jgi:hypothetical protein
MKTVESAGASINLTLDTLAKQMNTAEAAGIDVRLDHYSSGKKNPHRFILRLTKTVRDDLKERR